MSWYPEQDDIPIDKPDELLYLERLEPSVLEAMTTEELHTHLVHVASGMAKKSVEQLQCSYEESVIVVSTGLLVAGNSLGGRLGRMMIADGSKQAKIACREFFSEKSELQ